MDGINERIKQFFTGKGLNLSEVERTCGFKPQTFSTSIRRGSVLGVDKIVAILTAYPDISVEWLMRGEGEMIIQRNETQNTVKTVEGFNNALDYLTKRCRDLETENAILKAKKGRSGCLIIKMPKR